MPTPGRTTIEAVLDELVLKLRTNLAATPPTATKPFRRVEVGVTGFEEYPRPFLAVVPVRARAVGVVQNDKLIEVGMTFRAVVDVTDADTHGVLLRSIGAVEDYLDAIVDTGVLDGAEGFDDRVWTFEFPKNSAGARVAAAVATQAFIVKVQRGQNRVPAQ